MWRGGVELAGVGVLKAADIARELDAGGLHAEANAEVWHMLLASVADGVEHAFNAALAEAARNEDAVEAFELRLVGAVVGRFTFETLGLDPGNVELQVFGERAVGESFLEGFVAVLIFHVLADNADFDFILRVGVAMSKILPPGEVGFGSFPVEVFQDEAIEAFFSKVERDLVDGWDRCGTDNGALFDVTEGSDFLLDVAREIDVCAAEKNVGLDADAEQFLDGVLSGLCFELLRGSDPGNECEVNENGIFAAEFLAHLADSFKEWERFNVANGAADLNDGHVSAVRGDLAHGVLDLVGDVRDDLDGFAQVISAAFLENDLLINTAGGEIVVARERGVGEALVMA